MFIHSAYRIESGSTTITDRNRTGFIEQERIDIASRLDSFTGFRNHIGTQGTIHTGNTDSREKASDRRRNQTYKKRKECSNRNNGIGIIGHRFQRDTYHQENEGKYGQQNSQCDFIRSLLTACPFYESNHFIEEAFTGLGSNFHSDMIRKHLSTTGY